MQQTVSLLFTACLQQLREYPLPDLLSKRCGLAQSWSDSVECHPQTSHVAMEAGGGQGKGRMQEPSEKWALVTGQHKKDSWKWTTVCACRGEGAKSNGKNTIKNF